MTDLQTYFQAAKLSIQKVATPEGEQEIILGNGNAARRATETLLQWLTDNNLTITEKNG